MKTLRHSRRLHFSGQTTTRRRRINRCSDSTYKSHMVPFPRISDNQSALQQRIQSTRFVFTNNEDNEREKMRPYQYGGQQFRYFSFDCTMMAHHCTLHTRRTRPYPPHSYCRHCRVAFRGCTNRLASSTEPPRSQPELKFRVQFACSPVLQLLHISCDAR